MISRVEVVCVHVPRRLVVASPRRPANLRRAREEARGVCFDCAHDTGVHDTGLHDTGVHD